MHVCRLRTIGNNFFSDYAQQSQVFHTKSLCVFFCVFFCSCSHLGQIENKKEKIKK